LLRAPTVDPSIWRRHGSAFLADRVRTAAARLRERIINGSVTGPESTTEQFRPPAAVRQVSGQTLTAIRIRVEATPSLPSIERLRAS